MCGYRSALTILMSLFTKSSWAASTERNLFLFFFLLYRLVMHLVEMSQREHSEGDLNKISKRKYLSPKGCCMLFRTKKKKKNHTDKYWWYPVTFYLNLRIKLWVLPENLFSLYSSYGCSEPNAINPLTIVFIKCLLF